MVGSSAPNAPESFQGLALMYGDTLMTSPMAMGESFLFWSINLDFDSQFESQQFLQSSFNPTMKFSIAAILTLHLSLSQGYYQEVNSASPYPGTSASPLPVAFPFPAPITSPVASPPPSFSNPPTDQCVCAAPARHLSEDNESIPHFLDHVGSEQYVDHSRSTAAALGMEGDDIHLEFHYADDTFIAFQAPPLTVDGNKFVAQSLYFGADRVSKDFLAAAQANPTMIKARILDAGHYMFMEDHEPVHTNDADAIAGRMMYEGGFDQTVCGNVVVRRTLTVEIRGETLQSVVDYIPLRHGERRLQITSNDCMTVFYMTLLDWLCEDENGYCSVTYSRAPTVAVTGCVSSCVGGKFTGSVTPKSASGGAELSYQGTEYKKTSGNYETKNFGGSCQHHRPAGPYNNSCYCKLSPLTKRRADEWMNGPGTS